MAAIGARWTRMEMMIKVDKDTFQNSQRRERHREAISIAKRFLLADMVPIIEGGWNEEEGCCHGPGSTLEYLLWGSKA